MTVFHVSFTVTLLTISACTSTKSARSDKVDELGLSSTGSENAMVFQSKAKRPTLAKLSRKHWVELRKGMQPSQRKLMATLATGSWNAAEQEARGFLAVNPKDQVALQVLAISLSMQQKYQLAAFYAKVSEKFHSRTAVTSNLRGIAAMLRPRAKLRDYKEAVEHFQEAFNNEGTEIASGLNLGRLYLELGDAKGAASTFASVKDRCSNCEPGLVGSGIAHGRLRNYDEAKRNFELVLDKNPNHSQALYRLALIINAQDGPKKQAKKYLDRLLTSENIKDKAIQQKAQSFLRQLEAEMERDERTQIADENEKEEIENLPVVTEDKNSDGETKQVKTED